MNYIDYLRCITQQVNILKTGEAGEGLTEFDRSNNYGGLMTDSEHFQNCSSCWVPVRAENAHIWLENHNWNL